MTDIVDAALRHATVTLPLGSGHIIVDSATGSPVQFVNPDDPQRRFLLDHAVRWHSDEHAWGAGHVITSRGAARWRVPNSLEITPQSIRAQFTVLPYLQLVVERQAAATLVERYSFTNVGELPLEVGSLGIQTPFADLYEDAESAIERSVHAHIFTGGDWAWALAEPMSGIGRSLGLVVRSGSLWGYSIESRNRNTSSNARGHLVMQITDQARNPDAFGGQPPIRLEPGETYELGWEVAFYESVQEFVVATNAPATLDQVSALVGQPIVISTDREVTAPAAVATRRRGTNVELIATQPGVYVIDVGSTARVEVEFHESLEATVRSRARYILEHQRAISGAGTLAAAILPADIRYGMTQTANGWSDWSDGSERIGMALLLQMGVARGWVDSDASNAVTEWAAFAREHLIDEHGTPRRGSGDFTGPRLYDSFWLAAFFRERYAFTSDPEDLETAAQIVERAFELGADRFLAIGFSETCVDVANALEAAGQKERAGAILSRLIESARYFLAVGHQIPAHEVAYEQSIVAPLINLFIDAHRLTGDVAFVEGIRTTLPWLLAFGGPQPHARLRGVAIRHWDGYWFGLRRQWGDVFPHYWSALTASVLYRLPAELRTPAGDELADTILRANMSNYFADGSATCAFVFPTAVDGVAAHTADFLANDQDWHLVIWMDLAARYGAPTA